MKKPHRPKETPTGGQLGGNTGTSASDASENHAALPESLAGLFGPDTTRAFYEIRTVLPGGTYLAGGTAVAVQLQHRKSRDLDFFTAVTVDVEELYETLERSPLRFVTDRLHPSAGKLAITLGATKIEFSNASSNLLTEPTVGMAGVSVAGLGDLLAMKLATISKRRELRDYEDIRTIELVGGRRLEEGLALSRIRYRLPAEEDVIPMVAALARVDECSEDPMVVSSREELMDFFFRRVPQVISFLDRWDAPELPPAVAAKIARLL